MKEKYMELIEKYKLSIGYKASTGEEGIMVGASDLKRGSEEHVFIMEHKNEILAMLKEMKKRRKQSGKQNRIKSLKRCIQKQ